MQLGNASHSLPQKRRLGGGLVSNFVDITVYQTPVANDQTSTHDHMFYLSLTKHDSVGGRSRCQGSEWQVEVLSGELPSGIQTHSRGDWVVTGTDCFDCQRFDFLSHVGRESVGAERDAMGL